ncbi:DUF2569 domain-containing protein [Rhodoferax sp.]|uniref:DUF2569 domain-containing protein n=1 Tax=Rhodoferax sp. TaxID=50421 RepID=UPI00374D93DD
MTEENRAIPQGIGGWLVLIVIGLVLGSIRITYSLITEILTIFRADVWSQLTTPGKAAYHPLWGPFLVFEVFGNVVTVVLSIYTLYLLFRHSTLAPKVAIGLLGWTAFFVTLDFLMGSQIPAVAAQPDAGSVKEVLRSVASAFVWIPYFILSKRVKATFIK